MAGRLTKTRVEALEVGQRLWDGELKGFGVRRTESSLSYFVKYRVGHGRSARQRWYTIGPHGTPWTAETARREARRILGRVAHGEDPSGDREAEKASLSFRELAERFLQEHVEAKLRDRTAADYRRLLEQFAIPEFGSMKANDVTRADIAQLHAKLSKTPYQANRLLSVLSKTFHWGEARGYRADHSNPCRLVERYPEAPRERFLSNDELARLGAVMAKALADGESEYAIATIRLLVTTGARLSEILTLRWAYVDWQNGVLLLPDAKRGPRPILLSPQAKAILKGLKRIEGNEYVICGAKEGAHMVNLQKVWRRIRAAASLDGVRLHDLRHSFASVVLAAGGTLPQIGRLLGHSQVQTTARYAHLSDAHVKAAGNKAAKRIGMAMRGKRKRGAVSQLTASARSVQNAI
jgi:integrase